METKKIRFDESKSASVFEVSTILVKTENININFLPNLIGDVTIRFRGEVVTNGEPHLELKMDGATCAVAASIDGGSWMGKAQVDILLPPKEFDMILVKSGFANVTMKMGTRADCIGVQLVKGNIKSCADFLTASFSNQFGDISVAGKLERDIFLDVSSGNGDISFELDNVKQLELTAQLPNGKLVNGFKENGKYGARISAQTKNGNVVIK